MSKKTPTFYLLHGDDDIAIGEALAKMRADMGDDGDFNTSEYDGAQTSVAEILNAVSSLPFLASKRLVIVKGFISYLTRKGAGETGKKEMARLVDELPNLPDYARLVFVETESLRKDNKIVKLASSAGYEHQFSVPKDLTSWIMQRAKQEYQTQIHPAAAEALASVVGDDLRRADNELVKLVSYVDGQRPISEDDVATLTPYVAEASVFAMVDALATGDGRLTLTLIYTLFENDPSDPGFRVLTMIIRHFRLLLLTREYLDSGGSNRGDDLAKAISVRSTWQANKYGQQARAFTLEQLETIYRRLQQYDEAIKTGRIHIQLVLDLLVASLAK